jgi:ubiquinone/menaquinone biosynthesis C-methylase UbiE
MSWGGWLPAGGGNVRNFVMAIACMSFNRLAPHYRWMEFILAGEKLQRCRTAFLHRVKTAKNVLILGEGSGRFLVECRRHLPAAQITCLDASERMLATAKARLDRAGLDSKRVTFIHADVLLWKPPEAAVDLLVTHFFLDCFRSDQLEIAIAKLAIAAQPNATWLLADFQTPPAGLAHWRARVILKIMYGFFRAMAQLPATQLIPPDPHLCRHGFQLVHRHESEWGLLHSDLWYR